MKRISQFVVYTACAIVFATSCLGAWISSLNYPGGTALARFNQLVDSQPTTLHIDSFNAQNGVNLFGHVHSHVVYSKDESHKTSADYVDAGYAWLIEEYSQEWTRDPNWKVVDVVEGYAGRRVKGLREWIMDLGALGNGSLVGLLPIKINLEPKSLILKRVY